MKQIIKDVLNRYEDRQLNLASEKCRDTLAAEIEVVLESKGFYIVYTEDELVEQETRASWVCSICGENTFEVDCDYIGSGTNHLGCELEKGQKDDTPVSSKHKRGPDRRKSDRREGVQTSDDSDGITYKEAEHVAGFASVTHSEFMDSNTYDAGVDPKDYDSIQKQAYNEMSSDGLPSGGDSQAVRESHRLAEEIVDNTEGKYIYESPDGGKTIYRRGLGEDKRELVEDWLAEKMRIEDNFNIKKES